MRNILNIPIILNPHLPFKVDDTTIIAYMVGAGGKPVYLVQKDKIQENFAEKTKTDPI